MNKNEYIENLNSKVMNKKEKRVYQLFCFVLSLAVVFFVWQCRSDEAKLKSETASSTNVEVDHPTYNLSTQVKDTLFLLSPQIKGMSLMESLQNRQTIRSFSGKRLSDQQISNLLWAANGVNRKETGKRTAPSARNAQEIDIYLFTEAAIYRYDAFSESLILVKTGDYRLKAGEQAFYVGASIVLTYVADFDKMSKFDNLAKEFYSATDVGFVSQNVYLYCASENLSTVVCGMINREQLTELLELSNAKVLLSQPIGYAE